MEVPRKMQWWLTYEDQIAPGLFDYGTRLASDCRTCVEHACSRDAAVRSAR
jgi:hypothetical protein